MAGILPSSTICRTLPAVTPSSRAASEGESQRSRAMVSSIKHPFRFCPYLRLTTPVFYHVDAAVSTGCYRLEGGQWRHVSMQGLTRYNDNYDCTGSRGSTPERADLGAQSLSCTRYRTIDRVLVA